MMTETALAAAPTGRGPLRRRHPRKLREPVSPAFDREYWLRHCEGFKVETAGGTVGFVDKISSDHAGVVVLHVRVGVLGRRVLIVPLSSVAFIVPRAEKIWLAAPVQILESRQDPG
jgi:hypothetical protein